MLSRVVFRKVAISIWTRRRHRWTARTRRWPPLQATPRSHPLRPFATVTDDASETTDLRRKSWKEVADGIEDPAVVELLKKLDPTQPLWLDFSARKATKTEHPDKIVFVRSGEFYEAIGIDAVMLIHFAQMAPMVAKGIPRVRCSRLNLPYYLHLIVRQHGFEVVVCEQADQRNRIGDRQIKKLHYVAAVIGGAGQSLYLDSLDPQDLVNMDNELDKSYPLAAVAWSQTGFSLIQYFTKENALRVTSRMSEEGLWAKLHSTGMTPPLYLHTSSLPGTKLDTSYREWQKKARDIAASVFGSVARYDAVEPVQGFLQVMLSENPELNLSETTVLTVEITNRVSPPPLSTVSELGIRPRASSGVLPLMEYLLPATCQKLVSSWMEKSIVEPPPLEVASQIQSLCRELAETSCSIPQLNARLAPNRIVEVLTNDKWSVEFLDELRKMLVGIVAFFEDPTAMHMKQALLNVTENEVHFHLESESFLKRCNKAIQRISKVLREDLNAYYDKLESTTKSRSTTVRTSRVQKEDGIGFLDTVEPAHYRSANPAWFSKEMRQISSAKNALEESLQLFARWLNVHEVKSIRFIPETGIIAIKCSRRVLNRLQSEPNLSQFCPFEEMENDIYVSHPLQRSMERYKYMTQGAATPHNLAVLKGSLDILGECV